MRLTVGRSTAIGSSLLICYRPLEFGILINIARCVLLNRPDEGEQEEESIEAAQAHGLMVIIFAPNT